MTTRKEFEELMRNKDKRSGADAFWLNIGGDPERTKELIRKYYGRVVEANKLFTSYKEGWKTDRGMIFTIYGKPNIVYRTSNSESWVYGEDNSLLSTNFTFIKVINPFSDNDFTLSRSQLYQNGWYAAIESWRNGRAYND